MATINYLTTCLPDFFEGSEHSVFCVAVDARSSRQDIASALLANINQTEVDAFSSSNHQDIELAVRNVIADTYKVEYPYQDQDGGLEMPERLFSIKNDDGSYSLYQGDVDDQENADLIEDGIISRAAALFEACDHMNVDYQPVYAYFSAVA